MFEKYERMIKSLAADYFYVKEDAEDAEQEARIKLFTLKDQVPTDNPDAWAYVVIDNCMKDHYRRLKRQEGDVLHEVDNADHNDPYEYAVEEEQATTMYHNYDKLPKKLMDVCVMRYQKEMSYDAIAKKLGIPITTVGSRLNRAKEVLNRR